MATRLPDRQMPVKTNPEPPAGFANLPKPRPPAPNRDAVPACSPGVDAQRPRLGNQMHHRRRFPAVDTIRVPPPRPEHSASLGGRTQARRACRTSRPPALRISVPSASHQRLPFWPFGEIGVICGPWELGADRTRWQSGAEAPQSKALRAVGGCLCPPWAPWPLCETCTEKQRPGGESTQTAGSMPPPTEPGSRTLNLGL
jgi:hypothetical protein